MDDLDKRTIAEAAGIIGFDPDNADMVNNYRKTFDYAARRLRMAWRDLVHAIIPQSKH